MSHIVTVCVREDVDSEHIVDAAKAAYIRGLHASKHGANRALSTRTDLALHFVHAAKRIDHEDLVAPQRNMAAGGPVRLLDLARLQLGNQRAYWDRWSIWNLVVARTPVARPMWWFIDRHMENDERYSLERAHREFWAQPRVAAMELYNRCGRAVMHLPVDHLEAFQVGRDAYASLGYQTAVPGNAFVDIHGVLHDPAVDGPLAETWQYASTAYQAIRRLAGGDRLVALVVS